MKKYHHVAFLFPGQGAQYPGMGKELFEKHSIVRETFEEADDILGRSLSKLMMNGPAEELTQTASSQPAIFLLGVALYRLLQQEIPDLKPQYAAGLSLGEYTALATSNIINPLEALKLVEKRGRLMAQACDNHPGTMAALIGLNQTEVEALVKEANLPHDLWAANFNSPGQTVLSGTLKGIIKGTELALAKGAKKAISLKVHGAFHSGLMQSAQDKLREFIMNASFKESPIKVVMNASAEFPSQITQTKEWLIAQVTSPVRWQESIEKLQSEGVDLFVEFGPGKTLSGLLKRIGVTAPVLSFEKEEDLETIANELGK